MTVTKEMIEAMKSALVKYSVLMPIDAALSDALSAALSSRSAEAGKPVVPELSGPMQWAMHDAYAYSKADTIAGRMIDVYDALRSALSTPADREPVAEQWCAHEDGHQYTSWMPTGYGDRAGWEALAKRNPEKYQIVTRPLYAAPVADSEPVSVTHTTAMKPVPYDHEITLQSVKASSANVDGADPRTVLLAVLGCTETWVGDARIIGNVRAVDIAIAIRAALAAQGDKP